MEEKELKTGTTTIGLVCKDGILLAADKRATAGNLIVTKYVDKIYQINDDLALTMAGTVSDAQLLSKLIKAELKLKDLRTSRRSTVKEAANLLGGMVYSNIRKMSLIPGISHFVLGGRDDTGTYVYDLFADGSVTLIEDFISSGSGSVMAYGVLETLYRKDLSLEEGKELAIKAVNAAIQRDNASGGGIDIVAITMKNGVKRMLAKRLDTTITA
ncbi:MAG TPA: proteasome subunit beta [Candidatus Nanoarchaeia archaeon]|nr:proteasome subunit beta [Candidatus Nanoarchaeia archaeon]